MHYMECLQDGNYESLLELVFFGDFVELPSQIFENLVL